MLTLMISCIKMVQVPSANNYVEYFVVWPILLLVMIYAHFTKKIVHAFSE